MEFTNLDSAKHHQHYEGGWVVSVERTGQTFWYDHNHTWTEILKELPGYVEIS